MGIIDERNRYRRRIKAAEEKDPTASRSTIFVRVMGPTQCSFEVVSMAIDQTMLLAISGYYIEAAARHMEHPEARAKAAEVFSLWQRHFGRISGGSAQ